MRPEIKIPVTVSGLLIGGILFLGSVSIGLITAYTTKGAIDTQNVYSYITLFEQISSVESTLRELGNINFSDFNRMAAERLYKYSDLKSLEQSELVIKYFIKHNITHITQGLSGVPDIHIEVQDFTSGFSQTTGNPFSPNLT